MKCTFCGDELKEGCVFCSTCGKEAQLVPDYNIFDEDLLKTVLEEEARESLKKQQELTAAKKEKELQRKKKVKQQKIMIISAIAGIALLLIIVLSVALVNKNHSSSIDYQIEVAKNAYDKGDYEKAIEAYEKAIEIDKKNVDVRIALGKLYMELEDYDSALMTFQEVIKMDSKNEVAYENLIKIYENKKDTESILALVKDVKETSVLKLFADYIVVPPEFDVEEGEYEEAISLMLSSAKGEDIYYTMDGLDPVKYGDLYSDSIDLDEEGEYEIKAVCVNEKGVYSEVVTKKFEIVFAEPEMAVVTPNGGNYTSSTIVPISIEVPEGCEAYYTWDGTDPTIASTKYTAPIDIPEGNNVLAVLIVNTKTQKASEIYRGHFEYYTE